MLARITSNYLLIPRLTWARKVEAYNRIVSTCPPKPERILALDLGRKRIGLAISDELGFTAQGLDTLERQGRREDIETLRRLVSERGITRFLASQSTCCSVSI